MFPPPPPPPRPPALLSLIVGERESGVGGNTCKVLLQLSHKCRRFSTKRHTAKVVQH